MNIHSIQYYILLIIFSCLLNSCDKKQTIKAFTQTDSLSVSSSIRDTLPKKFIGTYQGSISCDDCEFVVLTLDQSNTYKLKIQLFNDEDSKGSIIYEQGNFNWDIKNSTIALDKFGFKFKAFEKKLYYLDNTGQYDTEEYLLKQ